MKFGQEVETSIGKGILVSKVCRCDVMCTKSASCPSTTYLISFKASEYKGKKEIRGKTVMEDVDLKDVLGEE